jgi:hypothetical protein
MLAQTRQAGLRLGVQYSAIPASLWRLGAERTEAKRSTLVSALALKLCAAVRTTAALLQRVT